MDINDVKAGEYQLVADRWDERTSKPGDAFTFIRHNKGDIVDLDERTARRLFAAGSIVEPGALEKAEAEAALQLAVAALQQLPDDVREQLTASVLGGSEEVPDDQAEEIEILRRQLSEAQAQIAASQQVSSNAGADGSAQGEAEQAAQRPPRAANKATWLAYRGLGDLTEDQAEDITVQQLQDDEFMASYQRPVTAPGA